MVNCVLRVVEAGYGRATLSATPFSLAAFLCPLLFLFIPRSLCRGSVSFFSRPLFSFPFAAPSAGPIPRTRIAAHTGPRGLDTRRPHWVESSRPDADVFDGDTPVIRRFHRLVIDTRLFLAER